MPTMAGNAAFKMIDVFSYSPANDKIPHMAKTPKSTSKKSTAKSSKPITAGNPMVDTNLAAESAARMLLGKSTTGSEATQRKKESSMFKNMKQSLNKPHLAGLDSVIGGPAQQKSNLPHNLQQQKGHNQTFNADVTRTGVPRRTPG